jgi:hypothetical protein
VIDPTIAVIAMMIPILAAEAGAERPNVGAHCAPDRLDVRR